MEVFIITVSIPNNNVEEREIKNIRAVLPDAILWNTKELDLKFVGEFGWKKLGSVYGIIAVQYMNLSIVQLLVKAANKISAESIAKKFSWHLDVKKEHKGPYVRRSSNMKSMKVANDIASRAILQLAS